MAGRTSSRSATKKPGAGRISPRDVLSVNSREQACMHASFRLRRPQEIASKPVSGQSQTSFSGRWQVTLATLALSVWLGPAPAMAAPAAFPPTEPGVFEVKTLPAGLLLKSTSAGSYFDRANSLFRPLFSYISRHKIAMTTPVEATVEPAAMYFWVAESERAKVADDTDDVEVVEIGERRVASLGARGGYSRSSFEKTRDALLVWLDTQPDLVRAGEAYGVFWHGPFTPWFAKRFEVHIPVKPVDLTQHSAP
jgi:hypothetical protein